MKINLETGKDIFKFRTKKGWSQDRFARAISISSTWVYRVEKENKKLGEKVLLLIEKFQDKLNEK